MYCNKVIAKSVGAIRTNNWNGEENMWDSFCRLGKENWQRKGVQRSNKRLFKSRPARFHSRWKRELNRMGEDIEEDGYRSLPESVNLTQGKYSTWLLFWFSKSEVRNNSKITVRHLNKPNHLISGVSVDRLLCNHSGYITFEIYLCPHFLIELMVIGSQCISSSQ